MIVTQDPPPVRSPRGGRPRDPSRDGVIRAAILRLLAQVGYGALTMDAVAAEAGVGKATIYRRWRTKHDLVVDTLSDIHRAIAVPPDTGSVERDARALLQLVAGTVQSPAGAAIRSLLPAMQHQPALVQAFREGPLAVWHGAFAAMWARAEERGEVRPGMDGSVTSEAISALVVQRWLLTGLPLDDGYLDDVFGTVVLPLLRNARPATA
ncbi:TetR/AcrR family transcriptional regulator [Geodermatophilus sp. DSM 44513]|uniref:TetR/AcrR family transcriptional regulator n=1 Tax=Geodermatophilus sp. DSM 44513 TaxID=1528104 RepID=UPI00126CD68C|nr:TetR/AcrR family transcriptional regulator [Geodermatophilus sp. DSM 44513]WNV76774.1 TetR/AcrR family transcriptional regulator [Geodermatophilus sp. DSM 44513]